MLRSLPFPIGLGLRPSRPLPLWLPLLPLLAAALLAAPLAFPRLQAPAEGVLTAPDESSALAAARAAGHPVEALADRTEFSQTFANPSGTMTLEESVTPVRARRADGVWVPVDYTLGTLPDGTVAPAASSVDVAFSGGGSGPMATITRNGYRVAMAWPGGLPSPTLRGATATYADVLPGVDLLLTAQPLGFSTLLVVKSADAARNPALRVVRLPLATSGVTLLGTAAGGLSAVDGVDTAVFGAPAASMWDASGASRAPVGMRASEGELDLLPDAGMLTSPDTRFPVSIDPYVSVTGVQQDWTKVDACFPDQTYWNGANDSDPNSEGAMKVGRAPVESGDPCSGTLWRTYFRMDVSHVKGKIIGGASFSAYETWATSCANKPADLYWTGLTAVISSSTDWAQQPSLSFIQEKSFAHGHSSSCAANWESFDVKSQVASGASNGLGSMTLMLRAPNEGVCHANSTQDTCEWKRFDSGHISASHTAFLSIQYNTKPNEPTALFTNGSPFLYPNGQIPCDSSANYVNTATPTLHASVSDPDDTGSSQPQPLSGDYGWTATHVLGGASGGGGFFPSPGRTPGSGNTSLATSATIPSGTAANGDTVTWSVSTNDGLIDGPTSPTCHLTIDTTQVTANAGITSTDGLYPVNGASPPTPIGTPGQFTFDPAGTTDVAGYLYGLNASTPWKLVRGSTATVTIVPPEVGDNNLAVRIIGLGGNLGPVVNYDVITGHGTTGSVLLADFAMDEGSGSAVADGKAGHDATAAGTFAWVTGHTGASGDHALDFTSSGSGHAATPDATVDTRSGFTVSAWVKLDDTNGIYHIVSQDGAQGGAGYYLESFSGTAPRWGFSVPLSDGPAPTIVHAFSAAAPQVGVWTHLVGVVCFDVSCLLANDPASGVGGRVYLYVNDVLQSTSAVDNSPWSAMGPMQIGRGSFRASSTDPIPNYTDYLNGAVDDVSVYWGDPCPAPTAASTNCSGIA